MRAVELMREETETDVADRDDSSDETVPPAAD